MTIINDSNQPSYVQALSYGWSWSGSSNTPVNITYTFDVTSAQGSGSINGAAASDEIKQLKILSEIMRFYYTN